MTTINQALTAYHEIIEQSRSENTARTYRNALNFYRATLEFHHIVLETTNVADISPETVKWFIRDLKHLSPSTESLYLTALMGFVKYLIGEGLVELNLQKIRNTIQHRARRPGKSLPQIKQDKIAQMLLHANNLAIMPADNEDERLRNLRDGAFLLVLADTGLRVHEACNLLRGDIDWNEGKAVIIGKGNKTGLVRFSTRSMAALQAYLKARGALDGSTGRPLTSLPLFARHDRGAGKKIKPITTTTGRNIVTQRVREALGASDVGKITPHTFRHYFVTTIMLSSRGNIKLAQKLARHESIAVTQRYAHLTDEELDRGYWEVFESPEKK
jgi:site-specific recombinase XerD